MDAAIKVTGSPWNALVGAVALIFERTPAKRTIASQKPIPTPSDEMIDCKKLYPSVILFKVTPRTAQFVVIRGR